jgi:ADP-ribose pyrophosphatase
MTRKVVFEGEKLVVVRSGSWEFVERKSGDGVAILAVTDDQKIVLVEQERVPLGKRVIELPAGLYGDEHEERPGSAACRELEEETGYRAERMTKLASAPSSPGLTPEIIHFYVARDVSKRSGGGGNEDEGEKIKVHEVPVAEVDRWLERKREEGILVDQKVYTGLYFHRLERNSPAA